MAFSQLERTGEEPLVAYLKVLPWHLPGLDVENHEESPSGQMESQLRFEMDILPSTWISDSTGSLWGKVQHTNHRLCNCANQPLSKTRDETLQEDIHNESPTVVIVINW
jgi:hypothetical protein